jgi:ABC-type polysaccharide/polyol phosphate transport system ATPase subunit
LSTSLTTTREPPEASPVREPAVSVRHVSKVFRIPQDQLLTLKERVLHPVRASRSPYDELRAVDDVSVDIAQGEFFGIVGRNGSGKSTLLKCVAGIYDTDQGRIEVHGRLSPFIELGVGFNVDLTARENVIINAIMLGLSRKEARARFDEIIDFAELGEFVDLRLKNYSSGMLVRLAFSVAIQVSAEVLLIDEVLAVGDAAFQQKCFDQFSRLKSEGRTIIFVTHDMYSVERYCDRVMVLERGEALAIGSPRDMSRRYNELNFGRGQQELEAGDERYGDHRVAEIRAAWFEDESGERTNAVAQDNPCAACFEVFFHRELEDPVFLVTLLNDVGIAVFAASTHWSKPRTGRFGAGQTVEVRVPFDNRLAPSTYRLTPGISRAGLGADTFDMRPDLASLLVHGTRFTGGAADLRHEFRIESV